MNNEEPLFTITYKLFAPMGKSIKKGNLKWFPFCVYKRKQKDL